MLVRNLSTGYTVDDTRNESGDERYSLEVARDVAWQIQEAKQLAEIACEMRREVSEFVVWLADATRSHAIDNSLCGNYEAFLSIEVGNWVRNNSRSAACDDAVAFVVNATRPRKVTVKVAVPVTMTRYTRNDDIDLSEFGSALRYGRNSGVSVDEYNARTLSSESVPLSYFEAQEANEAYHRHGSYNLPDSTDDESY
jgi:hypothetical protein